MDNSIKEKVISAIKEKGMSVKDVSKRIFMSEYQLKLLLKEWGVELSHRRQYKKIQIPDRNSLIEIYNKTKSVNKVAEYFGVGYNTANRWMKILKIPTKKLVHMTKEEKAKFLEEHLEQLGKINL